MFNKIWQTTCGGFKNESQNYSQIALASLINFNDLIEANGDTVYMVKGDLMLKNYNRKKNKTWEAFDYLNSCLSAYESDFMDEIIPFDYFMKRVAAIKKEFNHIGSIVTQSNQDLVKRKYPASEEHINEMAASLTKKQRFEDAIKMLKMNLDANPTSLTSLDSLARLYQLTGDHKNAEIYSIKAGSERQLNKKME